MQIKVIDRVSLAGDGVNEDRANAVGEFVWVIDGATDVLDRPLTGESTDSSWFAATLDAALMRYAQTPPGLRSDDLTDLPEILAREAASEFAKVTRRPPAAVHEHPSAAGLVARLEAAQAQIAFVSLADCSLIVAQHGSVRRYGVPLDQVGDAHLAGALTAYRDAPGTDHTLSLRERMLPLLKSMRDRLNNHDGYGAFSISPPPRQFRTEGRIAVATGTRLLFATDGFMRLVDVFARYDIDALVSRAASVGLKSLVDELRTFEREDLASMFHPRVKSHDDASAIFVEIVP